MLLWLLFLLGPSLLRQSGVAVELPPSRFQLERFQDSLVVTLGPGESAARIHFGRDPVTLDELTARLEKLRAEGAQYLVIPATARWWLDYYVEFRVCLESRATRLDAPEEDCLIYRLGNPINKSKPARRRAKAP